MTPEQKLEALKRIESIAAKGPMYVGMLALLIGNSTLIAGVYVISGLGWALIACAIPCLMFGFLLTIGAKKSG